MKSIKEFNLNNDTLDANKMCKVFGGKEVPTSWKDSNGNCGTDRAENTTDLSEDITLISEGRPC